MNTLTRTVLVVVIAAVALGAGVWIGRRHDVPLAAGATAPGARRVLFYRAPMSGATSPTPKKDPMGMDYVPVYEGGDSAAPGTVALDPGRVQTLGVRTEPVRRGLQVMSVRASATVAIDETREFVVAPRFEGWVAHLYANQTGMAVRAGQPLLAVYSPQLAAARQEIQLADTAAARLSGSDPQGAAAMRRLRDAGRARLRNWEVDAGGDAFNVVYRSKVSGVVIEKPVLPGARFMAGEAILKIADLSTVWAIAHVPVDQASTLAPGQSAAFVSTALPGESVRGRITFVQPVVDPTTRTVAVRVELPNPRQQLRPGVYGTLELTGPTVDALTVPASAVINSGTRQVALVQVGEGRYAPREVALGRRFGDRVEVLAGLDDGMAVVTSANFLIDAESNLQSALQGLGNAKGPATTPAAATPSPAGPAAPSMPDMPGMDKPSADPRAAGTGEGR
ncbi:MAG: efflux RND transporter periplasmic adaptor subunit [Lysobacter sp.]|nr:MAG: efflux RND transporter periplasmic adaptor subunit [Lysobacter sp.]